MTKNLAKLEQEIIEEFTQFSTIDEKYTHLFKLGDALPEMNPALKTEENRVKGCDSTVWFHLEYANGRLQLQADSDSMVIKGLTALLIRLIADCRPDEIREINFDFLNEMKIWKLASHRNAGLNALLDHIKKRAQLINADHNEPISEEASL